jgi:4'-phosphopantetheinyl transferase
LRLILPSEIEVWPLSLEGLSLDAVTCWLPWLAPEERKRFDSFYFQKGQLQFLATHALKRLVLAEYLVVAPGELRFEVNSWGKPYLHQDDGMQAIGFNLSHTDGFVACAVAATPSIGIDIERVDRRAEIASLARHSFSTRELAFFLSLPVEDQREAFFRLWTLKEAFVKAKGLGLSHPLESFTIDVSGDLASLASEGDGLEDASGWRFFEFQLSEFHRMAVAVFAKNSPDVRVTMCDPRALLGLT